MSEWKDKLQGNWKQIKGKFKQEYAGLTDDDLMFEKGKEEEFIGNLQEKLGKTKGEIKDMIDRW